MDPFSASHKHPYYVVAPPYRRESAGIRCLHMLCHHLNRSGRMAYLLQAPSDDLQPMLTGTDLLTPVLTAAISRDHVDRGQVPIVVYPETVKGNPFKAHIVVRYHLNFPGLLGGDTVVGPGEVGFAYSDVLAAAAGCQGHVLFIPPIDTAVFGPPADPVERTGSCFYADKYQKVHGGELHEVTAGSTEIRRGSERDQTSREIAALLQRSEVFYTYENTALAIEAVLCGCPAVFVPNPYLTGIIAAAELGPEGYAWGTDPVEVARARATVQQGAENYLRKVAALTDQLDAFVSITQDHATRAAPTPRPVSLVREMHVVTIGENQSLVGALFLLLFRTLPAPVEREIAKFCVTVGLKMVGTRLWDSAANRSTVRVMARGRPREPAL